MMLTSWLFGSRESCLCSTTRSPPQVMMAYCHLARCLGREPPSPVPHKLSQLYMCRSDDKLQQPSNRRRSASRSRYLSVHSSYGNKVRSSYCRRPEVLPQQLVQDNPCEGLHRY